MLRCGLVYVRLLNAAPAGAYNVLINAARRGETHRSGETPLDALLLLHIPFYLLTCPSILDTGDLIAERIQRSRVT